MVSQVFTLPAGQDLLAGVPPERKGKIDTGALSHDNDTAIFLDGETRMLYCCGGNGLACFNLKKFDGATLPAAEGEDGDTQSVGSVDEERPTFTA